MSKPEIKNDIIEPSGQNDLPHSEKIVLGGPKPRLGPGPNPCRLELSHEALKAAGMWPNDEVEVLSRQGEILVRRIGGPKPSAWDRPRPQSSGIIDELWSFTKEREARLKAAREGAWIDTDDEPGEEGEEPLSDEQIDQEAL